jgi:hypothetical protein
VDRQPLIKLAFVTSLVGICLYGSLSDEDALLSKPVQYAVRMLAENGMNHRPPVEPCIRSLIAEYQARLTPFVLESVQLPADSVNQVIDMP